MPSFPAVLSCSVVWCLMGFGSAREAHSAVVVDVPFDFYANERRLPADTYLISSYSQHSVLIQGLKLKRRVFVSAHRVLQNGPRSTGVIVFKRFGQLYFLRLVWDPGVRAGHELPATRLERDGPQLIDAIVKGFVGPGV